MIRFRFPHHDSALANGSHLQGLDELNRVVDSLYFQISPSQLLISRVTGQVGLTEFHCPITGFLCYGIRILGELKPQMAIRPSDGSQRRAAKTAGLAGLLSFAILVAVNYGIFARLIVRTDPVQSAQNILAHQTSFRVGIAGVLVYCAGIIVLLAALYVILKPVSTNLALLAALARLVYALMWLPVALNLFTALRLLTDADLSRAFGAEQTQSLLRIYLSGYDAYYIGLLFWGLGSAACSVLWLKSKYVPARLAIFGVFASVWCIFCTFTFYLFPTFEKVVGRSWFDSPLVLFELALSFLLLFKGLRVAR